MRKIIIGIIVVALLVSGIYVSSRRSGPSMVTQATPTAEPTAEAEGQVTAEGSVLPIRYAALSFPSGGIVSEVLVSVGDSVQADEIIARLESGRPAAAVAQAQAALAEAQARYNQLKAGATPEEIAAAEAALAQMQAQQRQTDGNVTAADIRAAEAALAQARATLNQRRAGAKATDLRAAEASLTQAKANLQTQRDQLSAAKTNAQLALDQAVASLTQAQSAYVSAKSNWEHVQNNNTDPLNPSNPNNLNDPQRQQYYNSYIQAQEALKQAQDQVAQAQVAYDGARQAEVTGVQSAEQQVISAQAMLDKLAAGTDADQISAAQAQVAIAQANLERLRGEQRGGALAAAQASVDHAKAELERLQIGTPASNLEVAQAQIRSAEAALQLAQVGLAESQLRTPFAGQIAALDLRPGEYVPPGTAMVQVADFSTWKVETTDLTELNVARLAVGDRTVLTFDAISDLELPGRVSQISTFGRNRQGDIVYTVVVTPDQQDARLRWNMTATVTITPTH